MSNSRSKSNNKRFDAILELESLINNGANLSGYDGQNKSVEKEQKKWKWKKKVSKT